MDTLIAYLAGGIASFTADPADSDFQKGYLACLEEVKKWAEEEVVKAPAKVYRGGDR